MRSLKNSRLADFGALAVVATLALFIPTPSGADSQGKPRAGKGELQANASIVRGRPASIQSYPWLAHIRYKGELEPFDCTGTVVAPRVILTAGHCVLTGTGRTAVASRYSVTTGIADLAEASPASKSEVTDVVVFPGYNASRGINDAGLLVLATPVTQPVLALATSVDEALRSNGMSIQVAGWGLLSARPPRSTNVLHEATSVVRGTSYCRRVLRQFPPPFSPASQLCIKAETGRFFSSVCSGDSGGPGIARRPDGTPVQIGIISQGVFNCGPRTPQVLARVDQVSSWIFEWIDAVERGAPPPERARLRLRPPSLSWRAAKLVGFIGLTQDFGRRFSRARGQWIGNCKRLNRQRIKCEAEWQRGIDYYRGAITAYTALPREGTIYNYRYKIRRFNANCWLRWVNPKRWCRYTLFTR